jgi:hypothetical protein
MTNSIEQLYPHVAEWVKTHGWIEIGADEMSDSFVRALDSGGLVWEGKPSYDTLSDAMEDLETGLVEWLKS